MDKSNDVRTPNATNGWVDEELLIQMKELFVSSNKNTTFNIAQAMNQGQVTEAHRLAHTLKSSAILIGQEKLSQMASNAEALLKKNIILTQEQLSELETELARVLIVLQYEL